MGLNDIVKAGMIGVSAVADSLKQDRKDKINLLVRDFSKAWWAEKIAKKQKDKIKIAIMKLHSEEGIDMLDGDDGLVKVVERLESTGLIAKMAQEFLTEEQIKRCTGVTKKGYFQVEFTPKKTQ